MTSATTNGLQPKTGSGGMVGARPPAWVIILAAATITAIGMGIRQVMGLYLKPVSETLHLGREVFALAIAIANLVWGIAAPITGAVSDSFGSGRVAAFGSLMTLGGLLTMYFAQTEMHLFASGVLLGLGVAGCGVNAMVGAVARSVAPALRTRAIAMVGMGSGVGILVAMPYTHVLMSSLGWQTSLLVLAASAAFILILAVLVRGQPAAEPDALPQSLFAAVGEAARYPSFWLLNAGFFVCGFHVVFYGTHVPAYVADKGLEPWVGVAALTMVGIGNLVGTYLAGEWGRRWPQRYGLALIYFARVFVFLGFLVLPINPTTILVLSFILGVLWLSTVPLTSGLVATFFGARWMTMLYGFVFFSHQVGAFLGAWLGGYLFDRLGSYNAMWWISVGLGLAAAALSWPIREQPVVRTATPS
ncbi:MAG: MFS transporter [Hyphomicrobiaceae bacterium]|nr:MFS transporter [Hyphomicrobiaceae bacterium]MCC0011467.1 MFS transporter [Hyphomicrobiaceae bacterium]